MSKHIQIKTNQRVKELLPVLQSVKGVILNHAIDSLNHGEGYDLSFQDITFRIYDTERTDEVLMDKEFLNKTKSYEEVFNKVVLQNKDKSMLDLEIDRHDENRAAAETLVALLITALKKHQLSYTKLD
ncbi:MAG: hypothetical protein NT150_00600 [Bacteroidetes bacterium]|nr:hypothetical protein [Bacteroidota bacterium]